MKNNDHKIYQSTRRDLPGSSHAELLKNAWKIYNTLAARTRRLTYIRSKKYSYFAGKKIFINSYLPHISQKNKRDAERRLRLVLTAFDLIENTTYPPILEKQEKSGEKLLRFLGYTRTGLLFCVQIRVNKKGEHYLMSAFPYE